jgi:hypothetical protein
MSMLTDSMVFFRLPLISDKAVGRTAHDTLDLFLMKPS